MITGAGRPSRLAVGAAYVAVASVLPSGLWRASIGFGAKLGTTEAWRQFQHIPGSGTAYVLFLTVASVGAAALTFGLVRPWGERVPRWVPRIGGRPVPVAIPVLAGLAGGIVVMFTCAMSVIHWDHVIGFVGRPAGGCYALAVACYLSALAWGPCVLIATVDYWRRRRRCAGPPRPHPPARPDSRPRPHRQKRCAPRHVSVRSGLSRTGRRRRRRTVPPR